jgi:SNF family Na+-dependent transporter
VTFLVVAAITIVLSLSTVIGGWVFSFVWAFFYNRYYTRNLISKGYKIVAATANEQLAAMTALGVA